MSLDMQGRWVLADVLPNNHFGLLAVGGISQDGRNFRRSDPTRQARFLLLNRFSAALQDNRTDFSGSARLDGHNWDVTINAIRSPHSQQIVAFQGIYKHEKDPMPEPQTVGGWEWEIESRNNPLPKRIHWDSGMPVLYEMDPSLRRKLKGDPGQWANELLAPKVRGRLTGLAADWIRNDDFDRHLVDYTIVTRYGTSNPGQKHLRMSARLFAEGPDERLYYKGISFEAAHESSSAPPAIETILPEDVMRVAYDLCTDRVLFCCDTVQQRAFMKSPSWQSFGLAGADTSNLDRLVHPEDFSNLDNYFADVRRGGEGTRGVVARFANQRGEWLTFSLKAKTLDRDRNGGRYLLCRLAPM